MIAQSMIILETSQPFIWLPPLLWSGYEILRSKCTHTVSFAVPLLVDERRSGRLMLKKMGMPISDLVDSEVDSYVIGQQKAKTKQVWSTYIGASTERR